MNLKFEEFQKSNSDFKELNKLRVKNFKKFETLGFPTKKQEHWKYTDLKTIINNNFEELQIYKDVKKLKFNTKLLIKNFEHNSVILLNE